MIQRLVSLTGFVVTAVLLPVIVGCTGDEERVGSPANELPPYVQQLEVTVRLGPRGDLRDLAKDDLFFTVENKGDEAVKELHGDIVFRGPDGVELGRVGWLFIQENPSMERMAKGEKKAKWRPLPAGATLSLGADVVVFFAGSDRPLQRQLEPHWDQVKAEVAITKLVVGE